MIDELKALYGLKLALDKRASRGDDKALLLSAIIKTVAIEVERLYGCEGSEPDVKA